MTVLAAEMQAPLAQAGDRIGDVLDRATAILRRAGVETARRDARLLLAEASALGPAPLLAGSERQLSAAAAERFAALVARRRAREPVSRILGQREFRSLEFAIAPATLDPRPDSETVIDAVLARLEDPVLPRTVLDLGTGSGCLLLALLSELPGAWGLGLDHDPVALTVARQNAATLGLAGRTVFAAGDWGAAIGGQWQVILCNPPYVKTADIGRLAPEVGRFEPRAALDGGPDGLAAYRRVIPDIARLLAPGGLAALELGAGQARRVEGLLQRAGLVPLARARDLAGIERCLLAGPGSGSKKGSSAGKSCWKGGRS